MKRLVPVLILFVACSTPLAPPPQAPPPAAPPSEMSSIVVPIQVSLAPLLPMVEAQVPKSVAKTDAYEIDPQGRFGIKYRVERQPISLQMIGSGLHVAVPVRYALEGCARTRNPVNGSYAMWPCVSCGFNEAMREATIGLQSRLDWRPDWTIRSTTQPQPIEFPNRCKVTFANVDVTDWKLGPLVSDELQTVAKTIDKNTPGMTNFRPAAAQVWTSLQTPYEIAARTWLFLEPVDVALAPIHGSGLLLNSGVVLQARTRIVIGDKPSVTSRPLPPLRTAYEAAEGIRVPFDVEISYEEAGRLLNQQFGGKKYDLSGAKLAVNAVRLTPGAGGKVRLEADIDYLASAFKSYRGIIVLDAVPIFDGATNSVSFTDLEYGLDARRRNPFLRTANRLAHDAVLARLRESAHWSLGEQTSSIRTDIDRGLTRTLAPGVLLRGRITSIQPTMIAIEPAGIRFRVVAVGNAAVEITKLQ